MKSVAVNVPGYKNPGFRRHNFGRRRGTSGRAKSKERKRHADGSEPTQKAMRKRAKRKVLAALIKDTKGHYPYMKVAEGSYFYPTIWLRCEIDLVFSDGRLIHPRTIFLSSENTRSINSGFFGSAENTLHSRFLAGNNAAPDVNLIKPERQRINRNPWD